MGFWLLQSRFHDRPILFSVATIHTRYALVLTHLSLFLDLDRSPSLCDLSMLSGTSLPVHVIYIDGRLLDLPARAFDDVPPRGDESVGKNHFAHVVEASQKLISASMP